MNSDEVEFFRATLLAVSPSYPGFEQEAMIRNIHELCDLAQKGLRNSSPEYIKGD